MEKVSPIIHPSWKEQLVQEFESPYFCSLKEFLVDEKKKHTVFPPGKLIFNAFDKTPFDKVKVVILGQDPYHGSGQAHGLCFSVPFGVNPPPSLINIFKEIHSDLGIAIPAHGNLESWAVQGVLLLNATLTVRKDQAGSHQGKGWEQFTDSVIMKISGKKEGVVFLLWGKYAQAKEKLIDSTKHHVLSAPHPSPFSVHTGFFGCRHFSRTNEILKQQGLSPVNWGLSEKTMDHRP
jgi:uracil-DNA glycosylase